MGSAGGDQEDSFAILLALHSPELTVEGLTIVQGNVPVDHGYANATHLLGLLGRDDVPVCAGHARPLNPARKTQIAWRRRSTVSLAWPRRSRVCEQTHLHQRTVEVLASGSTELARFVARAVQPWIELRRAIYGASDLHLYDSLAVAVAFLPELVPTREAFVVVETEGTHTAGATVTYLNPILRAAFAGQEPNASVALTVEGAKFEALFAERVIEPLVAGAA
jgi:inosine-uridine nucleoside N-ribohydrolase